MPIIDNDDSLSWPIGWEPEWLRLARESGVEAYQRGDDSGQNPFSPSTRSWRAWNQGYDAAISLDLDGFVPMEARDVL